MFHHYTTGRNLRDILAAKTIYPCAIYEDDDDTVPKWVWFSCRRTWEPVENGAHDEISDWVDQTKEGMRLNGNGLFRISVVPDVAPQDYKAHLHQRLRGIAVYYVDDLIDLATDQKLRFLDYRFSTEPVPSTQWSSIETEVDGVWIPFNPADSDYFKDVA